MSKPAMLQINARGSWRNVCQLDVADADATDRIMEAAAVLATYSTDKPAVRVVKEEAWVPHAPDALDAGQRLEEGMSNSRTPRAKRHGATQMPSKTFQTQNPGGCPACADRPLKTAARLDVLAASILGSVFGVLGALLLAMPALPGWGFGAFLVSNLGWLTVSAWATRCARSSPSKSP